MKAFIHILFFIVLIHGYGQSDELRKKNFNTKGGIVLEGYDPVSYFTGKPLEGKSINSVSHRGVTYLFATQANLDKFKADPAKYEPAYGGWCAFAMGENGDKVKIDPETFKILNGKLYLFYNFWGNNTLEDWNKKEQELKNAADKNWRKFIP